MAWAAFVLGVGVGWLATYSYARERLKDLLLHAAMHGHVFYRQDGVRYRITVRPDPDRGR